MPRPLKPRRLEKPYRDLCYVPAPAESWTGGGMQECVTPDEVEALRLADCEGLSQGEGAALMGVSRATFGRIAASGRGKVARALSRGEAFRVGAQPIPQTGAGGYGCGRRRRGRRAGGRGRR